MKKLNSFLDIYSKVNKIDGWLSFSEAFFLYYFAKKDLIEGDIVEIGSWKGKSTICLALGLELANRGKVYAVDPHEGIYSRGQKNALSTYKEFKENLREAGLNNRVVSVVKTSEGAARNWKKKSIRFLFIDGLHDYESTLQDFSLWEPFVRKGGIIAFHDAFCGHTGPQRVVLEKVFKKYRFSELGVIGSIVYIRKGSTESVLKKANIIKSKILFSLAICLNNQLPSLINRIFVHKIIKLLLLNRDTFLIKINLTNKS